MIPDELFEECLVVLRDDSILEEDQAETISGLIASKTSLEGKALDNEVLDVLWRYREKNSPTSSPPVRTHHTIVRRASPAPWQLSRVNSPAPSLGSTPPGFSTLSRSPFPSPRPSPSLAFASPFIPHSPSLSTYEPALVQEVTTESYGDYGSDTVQWLLGDDNAMGYAAENMSPHDMLRSVLGEGRTDEEIDQALEHCGYDLGATLAMLMEQQSMQNGYLSGSDVVTIVGKSTTPNPERSRPMTPRSGVVCRYFLSQGQCLRSDCRFSHDVGTTICKYWMAGSCLAGASCPFSHNPTASFSKMTLGEPQSRTSTPPPQLQFQDPTSFPTLSPEQWASISPPPGFKLSTSRSSSRPSSRQQIRERDANGDVVSLDDTEAFPSLGSTKTKKRESRNKTDVPTGPASLAEVVRMSPSPGPYANREAAGNQWSAGSPHAKRSGRMPAAYIPKPQQIPWLETGSALNRMYLKHRQDAINHSILRAKFLQLASAAWQRNDAKSAKEHSRKANNENLAMVRSHKEAAKAIYEERNREAANGAELYVDLHGLLPDEAVKFLEEALVKHQAVTRPLYAIVGTGHHSKGGKDKVSRAVRAFLDEWRYAYREFSVNSDRNSSGGILGIDPSSYDRRILDGAGREDGSTLSVNAGDRARPSSRGNGAKTQVKKK